MSDIPPSPVSITAGGQPGGTAAIPHDPVQARVIDLLKADPSQSDRSIAEAAGTEHKRVGRTRKKLIAGGTIAPTKKSTGKDGRVRRRPLPKAAANPPPPDAPPVPAPDLATGVAADILGEPWDDALKAAVFHVRRQLRQLRRGLAAERGLVALAPVAAVLAAVAAAVAELGRRADGSNP